MRILRMLNMPNLQNVSCKGTTTSLGMSLGTLAPDPRGLCRLQRQKSAHSHQCSLKMNRGQAYRGHKLKHHKWKIKCFATHGFPNPLVCNNGPCFTSLEFAKFTRKNGNEHKLVSPYNQALLNGQAESGVKIVKSGPRWISGGTLEIKLSRFLLFYRTTSYTTTRVIPELLMKRKLQTNLEMLKPSTSTTVLLSQDHQKFHHDRAVNMQMFHKGQEIFSPEFLQ